jgi:glycosyltransferase involved in cell wall biosynthesis
MLVTSIQPVSTPQNAIARPRLAICTAMTATPGARSGSFVLTRKFLEGVMEHARHWPGSISVWIERAARPDSNLDHVEVHPTDVPFDLGWIEPTDGAQRFARAIESADLVLAALVDKHVVLAELCRAAHTPLVYISEYSVKTREQIVRAETRNPLLRWRRIGYARRMEKRYRQAVAMAAGVQCNGLPTYNAYRSLSERAFLYFDTRVRADQLVDHESLERRLSDMQRNKTIRLAFSGRLIAMKGADHLPLVARELARLNVPFTLDICGGGNLVTRVREDIAQFGLANCVRMRGVLDFERELLPLVSREVDLFVCCHRQGDPSCTYLETYSCGVPIVGYDNEAFAGLASVSNVGGPAWVTPLDDPITLARRIADLTQRRDEIAAASHNAVNFAIQHTFEHTMRNRVQHMIECMQPTSQQINMSTNQQ